MDDRAPLVTNAMSSTTQVTNTMSNTTQMTRVVTCMRPCRTRALRAHSRWGCEQEQDDSCHELTGGDSLERRESCRGRCCGTGEHVLGGRLS